MNLFLGPIPESAIGARLFEVVFPPRQRHAATRHDAVEHFHPLSHVEVRALRQEWIDRYASKELRRPFDWARDDPDLV